MFKRTRNRLYLQSINARAFEHCVIRCGLRNVSYWCTFNHVSRLYNLIFIKLPCEPGRKGACPDDWITQQITQCTHVQTHMQSTVYGLDFADLRSDRNTVE